jgi:hypothetical protein
MPGTRAATGGDKAVSLRRCDREPAPVSSVQATPVVHLCVVVRSCSDDAPQVDRISHVAEF